jgi:lantibiotic biosynthesis protein
MRTQSLAEGVPGAVLLAVERDEDVRPWLARMLSEPVMTHDADVGLFEGAPAVAFALGTTGNWRTQAVLDEHVRAITRRRLKTAHRRIDHGERCAKHEYDLISGLTGLGVYLLRHGSDRALLTKVLAYLVRLTEPHADGLPGWWALDGPTGPGEHWAEGHGNLGMSHGIAGPLTLLALTMRRGIVTPGQTRAMRRIIDWLQRHQHAAPRGGWRGTVHIREEWATSGNTRRASDREVPGTPSWCYGTPGIARALQMAGLALSDLDLQHRAEDALLGCVTDESQLALLADASLCHGWAGVMHLTWRASQHAPRLETAIPRLLAGHVAARPTHGTGILTGTAGVALADRAVATATPPRTRWDALALLDD